MHWHVYFDGIKWIALYPSLFFRHHSGLAPTHDGLIETTCVQQGVIEKSNSGADKPQLLCYHANNIDELAPLKPMPYSPSGVRLLAAGLK